MSAEYEANVAYANLIQKRARSIYYALMLANVIALIAVWNTNDVDFFAADSTVKLPFIEVPVKTKLFYLIAPIFLFVTYIYQFHYFVRLIDIIGLRKFAAGQYDGVRLKMRIDPWAISEYFLERYEPRPKTLLHRFTMSNIVFTVSFMISILLTPYSLYSFWRCSFAPHDATLSFPLACLTALVSATGLWVCLKVFVAKANERLLGVSVILGVLLFAAMSVHTFDKVVGRLNGQDFQVFSPLYVANLANAQLSIQPSNWKSRNQALMEFLAKKNYQDKNIEQLMECIRHPWKYGGESPQVTGISCTTSKQLARDIQAFSEQRRFFLQTLVKVDLESADFRNANLENAFLAGVDADKANFTSAQMVNATLEGARLRGAIFNNANMAGADFSAVNFSSFQSKPVRLDGAIVVGTNFFGFSMAEASEEDLENKLVFECAFGDGETIIELNMAGSDTTRPLHWPKQSLLFGEIEDNFETWNSNFKIAQLQTFPKNLSQKQQASLETFKHIPSICEKYSDLVQPYFN